MRIAWALWCGVRPKGWTGLGGSFDRLPSLVILELRGAFAANAVRLQLHAIAYNLGNFLRTLATPEPIEDWSLTSLKEKLIKIGAKVVSHGRYVVFQMAEVAIPRQMFQEILRLIAPPAPA
jgi:hypothetical protein